MTHPKAPRFLRRAAFALAVPAVAAGGVVLATTAASAATTAPAYSHQRCDETLTYVQEEGYYGSQFVIQRNVCNVEAFFQGHRHNRVEDVTWQTEQRRGGFRDHFAENVRDVEVYH